MEKFIPYEKLSKKEKHRRDAMQRGTWGVLNPVTRKSPNPQSLQQEKDTEMDGGSIYRVFFYMQKRYPPAAGRGISKE